MSGDVFTKNGLCECGCGERTAIAKANDTKAGYIKGLPVRFRPGHATRTKPKPTYAVDASSGCWNWQGHITDRGYAGVTQRNGRFQRIHSAFYEEKFGAVPKGMELDHLCRNRQCVNPDHLQPVTHGENMQRSLHAKVSLEVVAEIRALPKPKWGTTSAVAAKYGIGKSQFNRIRAGLSWRQS